MVVRHFPGRSLVFVMLVFPARPFVLAGVPGELSAIHANEAGCIMHQDWLSEWRPAGKALGNGTLRLRVRYADTKNLGVAWFWIEGELRSPNSTMRTVLPLDEIRLRFVGPLFPEVLHLFPWIGCSLLGPSRYPEHAVWLASQYDPAAPSSYFSQLRETLTGRLLWRYVMRVAGKGFIDPAAQPLIVASEHQPDAASPFEYVPHTWLCEGKERDLAGARVAAIWPDATDEELCQDSELLDEALRARLPQVIAEFRSVLASTGLVISVPAPAGSYRDPG